MNKQTVTLSSGVVLNIKQVPPMVLAKIYDTLPAEPQVPRIFIADLGREEENPNDPSYLASMNKYQMALANRVSDTIIMLGTTLSSVPKSVAHPHDDYRDWSEPLNAVGIEIPDIEKELLVYCAWVKYVAATSQDDINNLIASVSKLSGVSEKDVAQAANQFRDTP